MEQNCNGECGATEEHVLEIYDSDTKNKFIPLPFNLTHTFCLPVLAGYAKGEALYFAFLGDLLESTVAVTAGATLTGCYRTCDVKNRFKRPVCT